MYVRASAVREKKRVASSQVQHLWRAFYQHRKLGFALRENSYLDQLERATIHPSSNCGKSLGSCGDETVAGMNGSIPELRNYIYKTKTRWEEPHHDHAPFLQRRFEVQQGTEPPEDDGKRAASPIGNHNVVYGESKSSEL
jgi:hypothetical protein